MTTPGHYQARSGLCPPAAALLWMVVEREQTPGAGV